MQHTLLRGKNKYALKEYGQEAEVTQVFGTNFQSIVSDSSFWIPIERQLKAKNFKNFSESVGDGFLLVWETPPTPTLYITEIELEKHDVDRHILPQLGNFISFIQNAGTDERRLVRDHLYEELRKHRAAFERTPNRNRERSFGIIGRFSRRPANSSRD